MIGRILRRFRLPLIALGFVVALPALGQAGFPAKGTWSGYWGPNDNDAHRVLLDLDWVNRQIVGTINPGPNAVKIDKASIDYSTWTMTIEANMPSKDGGTKPWIATGHLENLGSWTNRRYVGTYTFGDEHGKIIVAID